MTLYAREVTKRYRGGILANDHVSLQIERGEVFGLLGPNGAGKTTLVHQIIGLLRPTSGEIRLAGVDLVRDPEKARKLCSYLPQGDLPIDSLPVATAVEIMARIRGVSRAEARLRARTLLEALQIDEWRFSLGGRLSGGVRRLVGFVMAAVAPSELVILDEPTNDVDPLRRRLLWDQIRKLASEGAAVLLVTHNVLEAERSVDRLAILDRGRVSALGSPRSLLGTDHRELRFELTLEPRADKPEAPSFCRLEARAGRRIRFSVSEVDAARALEWARELVRARVAEDFELGPTSLEDAYLRIVGENGGAPA